MALPHYIRDKPDILEDSVQEICEKLAYEAHGGKFIVGLWEAPAPAVVNPLSAYEVDEWDTKPLAVNFAKVKHPFIGKSGRKLSSRKDWTERGVGNTFFGYKSDAPCAQLFRENAPIGPVSKAVKAAGELAAVAEAEGEESKPIWDLLEHIWKIDVSTVKNYVMPDVSDTTTRDLIKFTRRSSHMLYGFDGNNTQCKVELGHYRPETIVQNVYADWHRVSLSLRWLGEYIAKYQPGTTNVAARLAMAPVFREMPKMIACKLIPDVYAAMACGIEELDSAPIRDLAQTTMAFYQQSIARYDVKPYVQSAHTIIRHLDTEEWNTETIRTLVAGSIPARKRVGEFFTEDRQSQVGEDIYNAKRTRKFDWKNINELKFEHQISGVSALRLILEALYRGSLSKRVSQELRVLVDWRQALVADRDLTIAMVMKRVIRVLPDDTGGMVYKLLEWGSVSRTEAESRFISMIFTICPGAPHFESVSKTGLLFEALSKTKDIDPFMSILRKAISNAGDYVSSKMALQFRPMPGAGATDIMLDAIDRYTDRKLKFWATQYGARVQQAKEALNSSLKAKKPVATISEIKRNIVYYTTVKAWYEHVTISMDESQRVRLTWPVSWVQSWYARSAWRFASKRRKYAHVMTERSFDKVFTMTRFRDMAAYLDGMLDPPIKWVDLLKMCEDKTRVTRTSIEKTIKARMLDLLNDRVDEKQEEIEMLAEPVANLNLIQKDLEELGIYDVPTPVEVDEPSTSNASDDKTYVDEPEEDAFGAFDDDIVEQSVVDFVEAPTINLKYKILDDFGYDVAIIDIVRVTHLSWEQVEAYPVSDLQDDISSYVRAVVEKLKALGALKKREKRNDNKDIL